MKLIFLLIAACFAFTLADKKVDLTSDSLNQEIWIEAEKTETIRICLNRRVQTWETSLKTVILNDSCVAFQAPTLIGAKSINVYLPESDSSHRINLAIGMKYLNFNNEEVLLGFDEQKKNSSKKEPIKYNESGFPIIEDISQIQYGEWSFFGKIPQSKKDYKRYVSVSGSYLVDKYPVTNCVV